MLTAVQVEEWIGHPVTVALLHLLRKRSEWLSESKQDAFFPGEPDKTQEAMIELNARIIEVNELQVQLTDKETFEYVEELSGESKRDLPNGVQAIGEGGHY